MRKKTKTPTHHAPLARGPDASRLNNNRIIVIIDVSMWVIIYYISVVQFRLGRNN